MDFGSIIGALASVDHARKAVGAAVAVRDFNLAATELAKLNEALLNAQNVLFEQNTTLHQMQSQNMQLEKELAKLKEAIAQRARYALFEVTKGVFVYRANAHPGGTGEPGEGEPVHYVCQPCLDKGGFRSVLQRSVAGRVINLRCPICSTELDTGERLEVNQTVRQPTRGARFEGF